MKNHSSRIPRGINAALLVFFLVLGSQAAFALSSENATTDNSSDKLPTLGARAEAAIKRDKGDESLQKITSAPITADASATEQFTADESPTNQAELVKISPAPGTKPQSTTDAESSGSPEDKTANVEPASVTAPASAKETPAAKEHASEKTEKSATKAATKEAATAKDESVSAEQSLKWLTNGNSRYVKKHFRADGRMPADRQRLLAGQKPHAIVLSCSDSRVPPEIVFDQALGEIFVVRVAGEALDSSVIASIEYAVEHFDTHLLVVMGHTQCGAVEAALTTKDGTSAGSEAMDKLLADIKPRLKSVMSQAPSHNLEIESTLNADGAARDLVKRSEILRKKVEAGELVIKPALYRLDSGKVSFY
jgi:carbonic anhydrase